MTQRTTHLIKIHMYMYTHASCVTKFSRMLVHNYIALASMGGKPVTKYRKELMADIGKKDYADIVEMAVTKVKMDFIWTCFPL